MSERDRERELSQEENSLFQKLRHLLNNREKVNRRNTNNFIIFCHKRNVLLNKGLLLNLHRVGGRRINPHVTA